MGALLRALTLGVSTLGALQPVVQAAGDGLGHVIPPMLEVALQIVEGGPEALAALSGGALTVGAEIGQLSLDVLAPGLYALLQLVDVGSHIKTLLCIRG